MATKVSQTFYTALLADAPAQPQAPTNSSAILADAKIVFQKASDLVGYRNYLAQARQWKASTGTVDTAFETEVQAQATQACADGQTVAGALLRSIRQLKSASVLDSLLASWVAGLTA